MKLSYKVPVPCPGEGAATGALKEIDLCTSVPSSVNWLCPVDVKEGEVGPVESFTSLPVGVRSNFICWTLRDSAANNSQFLG